MSHSISVRRFCQSARITVFRHRGNLRWGVLSFLVPIDEAADALAELKRAYGIEPVGRVPGAEEG